MSDNFDTDKPFPHFLGSEIEQPRKEDARFHVLPVPLERSVSYGGGTARGPLAILEASWQLETWDGKSSPCNEGIYTHQPVSCEGRPGDIMERICTETKAICNMGKTPVVLGGEHALTQGVVRGILESGIQNLGIVQFDAHADLRDRYEGDPFSHASVMKQVSDLGVPILQLGIRALCEEEMAARKQFGVIHHDAEELVTGNVSEILLPGNFPENVYISVDIDGLDPSIFPATGTPVPGGLGWYQMLALFESVARQRRVTGFDVVELAPIPAFQCYDFAAAQLTHQLMGILQRTAPASSL